MENNMDKKELYFSVKDTMQDSQVGLSNLPLPIISELAEAVARFVKGSSNIDLNNVKVSIKEGSLAIVVQSSPILAPAIADYREIKTSGNLDNIDNVRARTIADFQDKAKKNPNRIYTISDTSDTFKINSDSIVINNDSDYRATIEDQWVQTETYIYGEVFDMGGKNKSNVHLTLQNGDTIKIDAETEVLAEDSENRLYKEQLVRIKAEQNIRTKKLRNETLVSFEKYEPKFDEKIFQAVSAMVKSSWADVPDVVAWVENVRGNHAQAT
jgi:archaellin